MSTSDTGGETSCKWLAFRTAGEFGEWLSQNHATEQELEVRIFKKASNIPTLTWGELVLECLCWGWIDSRKKSLDTDSYLQRITPRKSNSQWSQTNKRHVERLIQEGRMMPSGLAAVKAAKKDKRWEAAYAGAANMTLPDDFLQALEENQKAKAFFKTLDRRNLFAIYARLQAPAKRPATRANRMKRILDQLASKEKFH